MSNIQIFNAVIVIVFFIALYVSLCDWAEDLGQLIHDYLRFRKEKT